MFNSTSALNSLFLSIKRLLADFKDKVFFFEDILGNKLGKTFSCQGWQQFVAYVSFASVILGIKLWLISSFGNATPFWDQWDTEAAKLYKPFLDGTLAWTNLFALHNEHHIFTTRLLALALLNINGIWNPLLQMVVNAVLHIIVLLLSIALLIRIIGRNYLPALLVFSTILFGLPYAWENTLAGFQSQFYFVLMFSIACQWLIITQQPFSLHWWSGVICGGLAYFSLSSGIFAFATAVIVGFVFYLFGLRKTRKQLLAVVFLGGLFIIGVCQTPSLAHHTYLKATTFNQFIHVLIKILAWPLAGNFYSAIIRNFPAMIFIGYLLWKRPLADDRRWFLFTLVLWGVFQALSIAYGRAVGCLSSRYLDIFAVFVLVNFVCLISIAQNQVHEKRTWVIIGTCIWIGAVLISLGWKAGKHTPAELAVKRDTGLAQELNTRNYLATGDFIYLKDKPFLDVPYPNSKRLALILTSPTVRAILPTNIRPPLAHTLIMSNPTGSFVADGYYPETLKSNGMTLGSYGAEGNATVGEALIRFDNKQSVLLAIPVSGYPMSSEMKLGIEQNSQRNSIIMRKNPKESWGMAYVKVSNGPFSIKITDSSTSLWVAVGAPIVMGRLDLFTRHLLANWYLFIIIGLVAAVLLITVSA